MRGEERKKCFAERSLRAAPPSEGAGGLVVDTCCLSPVWNTGRLCRGKTIRSARCCQHGSMTEPMQNVPMFSVCRKEEVAR